MKILRTAVKDFVSLIGSHTFLTIVIIMGMGCAIMAHMITVGVLSNIVKSKSVNSEYNTFSCVDVDNIDDVDIDAIIANEDVENAFIFFESEDDSLIVVGWYGNKPDTWFPLAEGRFIDGAAETDTAYTAIQATVYDPNIKQTITVQNKSFDIVGTTADISLNLINGISNDLRVNFVYDYPDTVFISLNEAVKMQFENACVRVHMKREANGSVYDMKSLEKSIFAEELHSNVIYPSTPMKDEMEKNVVGFLLIGVICLICSVNILALYWYLLSLQKRKYTVYTLVGARPRQLWQLILFQYTTLFVLASLISLVLAYAMKPMFRMIELEYNIYFLEFILVFAFEFGVSFLLSLKKISEILTKHSWNGLRRSNG